MFKLFKRKKGETAVAHKAWIIVGRWIDNRQRRYADWLQAKAMKLSTRALVVIFLIFFLIMAGYSSYILYEALYY